MDPTTIKSLVSGCTAIAHRVGWILVDLKDLEKRYADVEVGITLLTSHLGNIRAMINRLSQRLEKGAVKTFELENQFRSSLEACDLVIETIQNQVARAMSNSTPKLFKFGRKRKHLWDEGTVKEHQRQLDSQLQSLSVFIRATQLQSPIDQAATLRSQESTDILTKACDDAVVFSGKPRPSTSRPDSAISMSSVHLKSDRTPSNPHKGPLNALMRSRSTHQRNLSAISERSAFSEMDEERMSSTEQLPQLRSNGTHSSKHSRRRRNFDRWAPSNFQANEPQAVSVQEGKKPHAVPTKSNNDELQHGSTPAPLYKECDDEFLQCPNSTANVHDGHQFHRGYQDYTGDMTSRRPSSSYTLTGADE
ncbi:hypothetical protein BU16DRAFT_564517 [Lophium mytilinum]|uniref:Fungal N-terminal domain-containing protein n=1 Tax=Lophium mytilinum TaxID=390894 RepID=A0A6A6QHY5_9PEZI|nr:hypothetical protein BU16DRAFT_564517 [Lophium mytilinum]